MIIQSVVEEMNRLGMMVDISHVNNYTMMDVLDTSVAPGILIIIVPFPFLVPLFTLSLPIVLVNFTVMSSKNLAKIYLNAIDDHCLAVIFSHSSSYALCPTPRNVPDNVLAKLVSRCYNNYMSSCTAHCMKYNNRSHVTSIKPIAKKVIQ